MKPTFVFLTMCLAVCGSARAATTTHPFGFDDMAHLGRLGGFDVTHDGRMLVFAVTSADVDENKTTSALWLQPTDGSAPARQISAGIKKDRDPRFSSDGTRIIFVSDRDGAPQLYLLDLRGGEPRKL